MLFRELKSANANEPIFITLKAHSRVKPSQWESGLLCSWDVISVN